jgi:NodT family efflux transporter outer membrane factor (OMF) lipoprotein
MRPLVVSMLGVLGMALGGCTVGPTFTKPNVSVPQNWHSGDQRVATQTAADSLWWRSFSDPTLDRLVEQAYRQNLPLQAAGLRIVEARAQLAYATGMQFPQVQFVSAQAAAVGLSENAVNVARVADVGRHFFTFQLGFDAAWEMDFWGKYRRGAEAATAEVLATMADYYYALVSLTAEVARTYVTIRTFEVLIDQTQLNTRLQEEALAVAQSRFRNGATSELDPTQATTLLESTRATIPQLEIGLQQARNALSTLLGKPAGAVDALLAGPRTIPRPPVKVAVGMPAEMLRRRPDIRRAELSAAAQCARVGVAEADLYPSFSLFGSVGLQAATATSTSANLLSPASLFYAVGPRIHWPFFNYGRLRNLVRVEDARFQQLLVAYRDTVLKAAQEVEDALVGFLKSQEATVSEQAAATSAQRSVEIATVQYREGAADYSRVLDAQRSLLVQQNSLARTSSSVATNLIALYKSLGGGWELRHDQAVVPPATQQEMQQRTSWGDLLAPPQTQPPPSTTNSPSPQKQQENQ